MTSTPHYLLVEDDESDILFFERAFRKAELRGALRSVWNGMEAIKYLSGSSPYQDRARHPLPTHVILDLKLPGKSGFEVLGWIRGETRFSDLPVAILTSSSERCDIDRAKELSANCYFVKPMSFTGLLEIVRAIGEWVGADAPAAKTFWPS